jgi:alpha-glucoside transport system permease protein
VTSTSSAPAAAAPAVTQAPHGAPSPWRKYAVSLGFLAPAAFFLTVWVLYPTIRTAHRSLYSDGAEQKFVWFDNYVELFSDERVVTAIKNNAIWVAVMPAAITAIGLLFAVLTERVRWAVAFKFAVFMPLAVSLFAVGVIWRIMYEKDPDRGVVNAGIASVRGVVKEEGVLERGRPSTRAIEGTEAGGIQTTDTIAAGGVALLGLTAIPETDVPAGAKEAVEPEPREGGITGVVWRDFKAGGGKPGDVESEERGLPGVTVELRDADGKTLEAVKSEADGTFVFANVPEGDYRVAIGAATFAKPFGGVSWLGEKLITPAILIAFLWASAGFAMVVIGAGLAAIPRDVLEAARTDGGTEWQVFRRVTVPLLAPVLTVVFVTQIIGVLKVFDIVLSLAPQASRDNATVIALEMWQRSFAGENRFGFGSAISIFLFLLFIPFLILNIRRFRSENA